MSTEILSRQAVPETHPPSGHAIENRRQLGVRALFMAATFVAYSLAEVAAKLTALVQIVASLCTLRLNWRLLDVGERLSQYIHTAWRFLLFCDEEPPWPLRRLWEKHRQ